ncbi:hypothetical protein SERLA73DRAFT_162620 [Serpula lacrymans var. lacrymans S7.3]|uniref:DNA recombination and repair protein Rad51-like C-terminal domain-containing protein n=2 Tax=Serpula lacrymans var. lacrymans TaxID=341189 RepID=F8Q8U3_SERL3|nr:uncharacterized protein SERLADRAFT_417726 [Serpula lacrymans var. lacrymans S7.9]EGN94998.1 hypothetical protein SERLA73DRAFT_162620 [Serpula lacrymans var. lacrymans S7.3]EGO20492.1 hypothetical protein SERLADRAFT_417726 [Serpula lacrymans var. lacrymans S7.9]
MALNDMDSESLQHLLSDTRTSPPLTLGPVSLKAGHVVEIQGPSSSGKSHVLYHILALSLLSSTDAAVVYDTDHAFSIPRLRSVLLARLHLQPRVDACLKRVHVFRPSSSLHLAASIRALPSYHARSIPHTRIALLILDSLSPFYWSDRFTAEEHRAVPLTVESSTDTATARVNRTLHTVPLHAVLASLQRLRASHRPLILYTNWALNPLPDASLDTMAYKQHLHFLSPHLSSLLPLTYHFTLPLAPFNPRAHPQLVPITADSGEEPPTDGTRVLCLLRTPGHPDVINRFTFRITHNDVIF